MYPIGGSPVILELAESGYDLVQCAVSAYSHNKVEIGGVIFSIRGRVAGFLRRPGHALVPTAREYVKQPQKLDARRCLAVC